MSDNLAPNPEKLPTHQLSPDAIGHGPKPFRFGVYSTFIWIVAGMSIIYGYRLWWDAPIDPSFVPLIGVCFAVVIAFVIVLALRYATGENIELEMPGLKFKGASGPIILWVVCFLSIVFALYMLGMTETVKSTEKHEQLPLPKLWWPTPQQVSPQQVSPK